MAMNFQILKAVVFMGAASQVSTVHSDDLEKSTTGTSAMPPLQCEIRQRAWCVRTGSVQITDKQRVAMSEAPGRTWILQEMNIPGSILIVHEPSGCRKALADTVAGAGLRKAVEWDGRRWNEISVRLRVDGSCDLKLLLPTSRDAARWAFSQGRLLVSACKDDPCTPDAPTIADVTEQYEKGIVERD